MKKGTGKAKGGSFERSVAKSLSLWLSNNTNDSVFWRSAMSGGRATLGEKEGNLRKTQSGDLSAIHSLGESFLDTFYVELKFYKDLNIESFLLNNKGNLAQFWKEAVVEAAKYSKIPLLIAKQNRKPVLIITTLEGAEVFDLDNNDDMFDYTNTVFPIGLSISDHDETLGHEIAVGFYDRLLEIADPKVFTEEIVDG